MGEIADALKRALGNERAPRTPPREARLASLPGPAPLPDRGGAPPAPRPARDPVPLRPANGAVVFEDSQPLEAHRQLAVRLRSELADRGAQSLAIVSGVQREGKTTVTCNLGIALATLSRTRSVALVDLDVRRPSLASTLGLRPEADVTQVIAGRVHLDDARISLEQPALDVFPAIEVGRGAHELLVLPGLGEMMAELRRRYEIVLVDTSPGLLVPDVNLILSHVDVCLPIARVGVTRTRAFRQLVEMLPRDQVLGELLNAGRLRKVSYEGYVYVTPSDEAPPPRDTRRRPGTAGR